jgi:hypothetical protein
MTKEVFGPALKLTGIASNGLLGRAGGAPEKTAHVKIVMVIV